MSVDITVDVPLSLAPPPTGPDAVPRCFGRYTLLHHLARGGMGEVYLAVVGDLRGFERICVVKTVRFEYARQRSFVDRFLDEGQLLTRLSHGHIAQVLDVGRHEDEYFLALEYVEGKDLSKTIDRLAERGRPTPIAVALHVGIAVLDALAYAHDKKDRDGKDLGLIHRDVSPQNILVSYEGDVKLIDFGNAMTEIRRHATAAGIIYGKPGYIAPEQARGEKPDRRSDLYAMGVTLWEILANRRLLAEDLETFLPRLRKGKIKPPSLAGVRDDVPSEIDRIIAKAMAPDREARHADAAAFRTDLASALAAIAPGAGPAAVAELMQDLWSAEIGVERRLTGQLLERAPGAITNPIDIPSGPEPPSLGAAGVGASGGSRTRYRILRKLGEGAMGEVFAAEHIDLEKVVALKVLHREFSQNQAFVERFRREARAVAKIGHPNIVQVTDFGETADGRVFFAMEKLDGESLESRLSRTRIVPEEEALRIAESICQALVAAHGEGIVHRDLKPDNVFLCSDGAVKLLDFGVAKTMGLGSEQKLTRAGEIWGTPEYMAPEQAANRGVDARTDLYAVGAMLYEMVTGSLPFRATSAIEILHSQIHDPPEPPSKRAPDRPIRIATELVILRSLAKDPAERFPSAEAMAAEVHAAFLSRARRSRRTALWAAGALLGVGLAGGLYAWWPFAADAPPAPPRVVTVEPVLMPEPEPVPVPRPEPAQARSVAVAPGPADGTEPPKPPQAAARRDPISEALLNARRMRERGDREGAVRASRAILAQPGGKRLDVQLFYVEALWASGRRDEARGYLKQVAQRHAENRRVQDLMQQYGVSP